jgi:uncharacterized protein (UPF0548 family)
MFYLTKPSRDAIQDFIAAQRNQQFSYPEVGCSAGHAPAGYTVDYNRAKLGQGLEIFEKAKRAIQQWKMFDMPWIELCWPDTPIRTGATVAVLISHLGFWSLNACQIVYVIDEPQDSYKYGFAYGTLPQHGEVGEERFTAEYNSTDGSVWYDLYALSRPSLPARIAHLFTRALQKRFSRDSKKAMHDFILR